MGMGIRRQRYYFLRQKLGSSGPVYLKVIRGRGLIVNSGGLAFRSGNSWERRYEAGMTWSNVFTN